MKPEKFTTTFQRYVNSDLSITHTKVITCFNQEDIIQDVLNSIVSTSGLPFDLHILDDHSEDNTLGLLVSFAQQIESPLIRSIRVSASLSSQFETRCDDYGIRNSASPLVIIYQADMLVRESSSDCVLVAALTSFRDVVAVSARGTEPIKNIHPMYVASNGSTANLGHLCNGLIKIRFVRRLLIHSSTFLFLLSILGRMERYLRWIRPTSNSKHEQTSTDWLTIFPTASAFALSETAGFLDHSYSNTFHAEEQMRRLWLGESIMRGPVIIDQEKYLEVGGFDTTNFFLGFDDHDFAIRSWQLKKYRVGFTPLLLKSDLEWGTTRKNRSLRQFSLILKLCAVVYDSRTSTALFNYESHDLPQMEVRLIG